MSQIVSLVADLANPETRFTASLALAGALGAENLIVFFPDPEIGSLLPALGFPQTLPSGLQWRSLLAECLSKGEVAGHVPCPYTRSEKPVLLIAGTDGSVLTLIGGYPVAVAVADVKALMPLLAAALRGERIAQNARASSRLAGESAARAQALADSLDRVRRDLGEALTKAKATSTENARLYQEVREADRRKDEFLAMLGHELRNPLAPIQNALQIMKFAAADPVITARAREMAERQVQHLMRLVDDLLDVARITRGKIQLQKVPVAISAIVSNAVETSRLLIESRRHELTVTYPPETILVNADAIRLTQVLTNLLNNAAKYTDEGGNIWLTVETEGSMVRISVRDTGAGIAQELLPKVFDLFTQIDRSLDRSQGGLGIGLTLVRRLVEMHDGDVQAHSAGPGRGSEFIVRLPVSSAPQNELPISTVQPGVCLKRNRILIVDDNVDAAKSLLVLLRLSGQEVQAVHDGETAINTAGSWQPSLILLDLGLPGIDGYEVARRLQANEQTNGIRLVALTGYGQEEDRRRSRDAGFFRHFVKPVDLNQVLELIADGDQMPSMASRS